MAFSEARLLQQLADFPDTDNYWVAFSGGLDSTVLLFVLTRLREQTGLAIKAIHADHGLQKKSSEWRIHCQQQCAAWNVPLVVCELGLVPKKGESLEALARDARYKAFAEVLGEGDVLLTAHHADDQVETVLLQLLRGAGVAGLAAMPRIMPWQSGWLARPLLEDSRESLQHFAEANELQWIEDPSNQQLSFDRNYLRHQVVPQLKQRWPGLVRTIPRSAGHCAMAAQLLQEQAENLLAGESNPNEWQLSLALLDSVSIAQQQHLLRAWIQKCDLRLPSDAVLKRILTEVVVARPGANPLVAWSGGEIRRYRQHLYAMPSLQELPLDWETHWDSSRQPSLDLPAGLGTLSAAFNQPVTVKFRSQGLRCRLAGRSGTRTFKQICQDESVPPWLRERMPLMFIEGQLLAIGDVAVCEEFSRVVDSDATPVTWERDGYLSY